MTLQLTVTLPDAGDIDGALAEVIRRLAGLRCHVELARGSCGPLDDAGAAMDTCGRMLVRNAAAEGALMGRPFVLDAAEAYLRSARVFLSGASQAAEGA